jgi:hypothetical protein
VVAGDGAMAMENEKDVVIKLTSSNRGVNLAIGPKGVDITMK